MNKNASKAKLEIDRQIEIMLSAFTNEVQSATALELDFDWEERPTLVIQLDVREASSLHEAFPNLVNNLKKRLSSLQYNDLKFYLFRENYEYTVIVPTVYGRLMNENIWVLYSLTTILKAESFEEANWVNYRKQPLADGMLAKLKIERWKHPRIQLANEMVTALATMLIMISQIDELNQLPDVNDTSKNIITEHINNYNEAINELLTSFLESGSSIIDEYNELAESEEKKRSYLEEAVYLFRDIFEAVKPSLQEDGDYHFDLEKLRDAILLRQLFAASDRLRLLIIDDTIMKMGSR